MNCPKCGEQSGTMDSRPVEGNARYRRRRCKSCGHKFTTYEVLEVAMLGYREGFHDCLKQMGKIALANMEQKLVEPTPAPLTQE